MAIGATRGFIGSIDCLHPEWKIVNLLSKGNILVMLVNQLRDWKLWHRTLCGFGTLYSSNRDMTMPSTCFSPSGIARLAK
jgi:hypothetical protein